MSLDLTKAEEAERVDLETRLDEEDLENDEEAGALARQQGDLLNEEEDPFDAAFTGPPRTGKFL